MTARIRLIRLALAVAVAAGLVGCGGEDPAPTGAGQTSAPQAGGIMAPADDARDAADDANEAIDSQQEELEGLEQEDGLGGDGDDD